LVLHDDGGTSPLDTLNRLTGAAKAPAKRKSAKSASRNRVEIEAKRRAR
jgi:hypothetical protein